jgi:hypothetical protein
VLVHRRVNGRGAATTSVDLGSDGQRQRRNHAREEWHLDTGALHELQK